MRFPLDQLVPGDVVQPHRRRPRAGRLPLARVRATCFVNQAMLTGEPYPVEKQAGDLAAPADEASGALEFSVHGHLRGQRHGERRGLPHRADHRLGGLAAGWQPSGRPTPSSSGIRRFGFLILRLTIFLVLFVLAANVLFHRPWLESLLFALALAVGLTPELLPMVVTVTLARGASRLARAPGHRQAPRRDPRSRRHGRAVHRQDRHADRGTHQPGRPCRHRR